MRVVLATTLVLVLLLGHGLGLPAPDPAPSRPWRDLWGLLRAIRDTSAQGKAQDRRDEQGNDGSATHRPGAALDLVSKQVSKKMSNMWLSVRGGGSLHSAWQGAWDRLSGRGVRASEQASGQDKETDLETRASTDVLDKKKPNGAQDQHGLVSSALERVWGTARTVSEMGRAVGTTVGRWGKAMADSVAGTVNSVGTTVNSAVGTVLQVINGGKQDDDTDHVCFDSLGCFSLREPWISSKRPLPRMNTPEQIQTKFYLHTRNSSTEPEDLILSETDSLVTNSTSLVPGARTFFIVHGFNDKSMATWVQDMKDALLKKMDCNIVLVDWWQGAQASKNYLQAASNTRIVGAEVARMVEILSRDDLVPMETVHAIGHSLGAHAAGYAGKQLRGRLGRITALDAAQPAFEDQAAEVRVAAGDARFVDVIHTNGVPFIPTLGLGVMHPVGDVDFYLNGGTVQPGCFVPKLPPVNSLGDLAALPVSVLGDMLSCSHRRAIEYFTEAIRSDCRMWGRRRVGDDLAADKDGEVGGNRNAPWWRPNANSSLGSLFAGVFNSDSRTTTETPDTTSPAAVRGFPFPAFLASVFSEGRTSTEAPRSFSFPFLVNMFVEPATTPSATNTNKRSAHDKKLVDKVSPVDSNAIDDTPDTTTASSGGDDAAVLPLPPAWCDGDCLPLGLDTSSFGLKGTFIVNTADHSPYCLSESNEV